MPERAAVIFLFAQEKLLFRYPLDNPFVIDMHSTSPASISSHRFAADNPDASTTTTATTTAAACAPGANEAPNDAAVRGEPSTQKQQQEDQAVASAALGGVGVRHKPRAAVQSRNSRRLQQQQQQQQQNPAATAAAENSFDVEGSGAPTAKARAPQLQSQLVENVKAKSGAETCVGIQTHALLHLLRASFSACTTIQFAGGTFLIYPLLPNDPTKRTGRLREAWRNMPLDSAMGTSGAGIDANTNSNNNHNDMSCGCEEEDEWRRDTRPSQGVLLVVAMNRPDREDGAIANFVQRFMNVVVREELHVGYATYQISTMERRLDALEMGDATHSPHNNNNNNNNISSRGGYHANINSTSTSNSNNNSLHINSNNNSTSHGSGATAVRLTATEMYARLLQDPQLTLCTELAQLARHISDADDGDDDPNNHNNNNNNNNNDTNDNNGPIAGDEDSADVLNDPNAAGLLQWRAPGTSPPSHNAPRRVRSSGAGPSCLLLRGLFAIQPPPPLRHGHCRSRQQQQQQQQQQQLRQGNPNAAPAYGRMNPNYLFTLDDAAFVERLSRLYVNAVGRHAAQLLPLAAVRAAIGEIVRPWRVGALYRALELVIADAAQIPDPNSNNNNNSNNTSNNNSNSNLTINTTATASVANVSRAAADGAALAAEAVEFLYRNGALVVDTAVNIVFTHGTLPRGLHSYSSSGGGGGGAAALSRVCPASLAAALLLSELRGVAPPSQPNGKAKRTKLAVQCAWGGACPLCEELAAAFSYGAWLSFPQLDAAVRRTAARRAQQQQEEQEQKELQCTSTAVSPAGFGELDAERFSLLADQRPWFTHPGTFISPVRPVDRTPLQRYRQLTCGDIASHAERARSPAQNIKRSDADEGAVAGLTLDNIPHGARVWLAANHAAIEERLNTEFQQRTAFEESLAATRDRSASRAESAFLSPRSNQQNPQPQQGNEQQEQEDQEEQKEPEQEQEPGEADKQCLAAQRQRQRYRKRPPFVPSSAPVAAAHFLPHSPETFPSDLASELSMASPPPSRAPHPIAPPYPQRTQNPSQPHTMHSNGPARWIGTARTVPLEVLMQFVLHHMVALLWGREGGMSTETLLRLLERNLRLLPPFIANYAFVQQFAVHAAAVEGSTATAAAAGVVAQRHSKRNNEMEKTNQRGNALGEDDMPALEWQLLESYKVFEALSLIDALRGLNGMTVDAVPTRLLLHATVNAFSDVLLIGGCGPVSDELQGH